MILGSFSYQLASEAKGCVELSLDIEQIKSVYISTKVTFACEEEEENKNDGHWNQVSPQSFGVVGEKTSKDERVEEAVPKTIFDQASW